MIESCGGIGLGGLLELRGVRWPLVIILEEKHILPINIIQLLEGVPFTFLIRQLVQLHDRVGPSELFLSQLIAFGAHLLHAFEKLNRNPVVYELLVLTR